MWNLFKRTNEVAAGFCDRCGRVCDESCRRAMLEQLRLGIRI